MSVKIILDTPTSESLQFLLEEMVDDPYVGRLNAPTREVWIDFWKNKIEERREADIQSTVAYIGSGIVGIAFSRPLGDQSVYANVIPKNDYWKMGNFYVLKAFRGQGIGKKALAYFLEVKNRKVFYFADRTNAASNAVASANGMFHTHDFLMGKVTGKGELCKKDQNIRSPATYFRVYCGEIPPKKTLLKPFYAEKSHYEN